MMTVLGVLTAICAVAAVLLVWAGDGKQKAEQSAREDRAAPYRDGLHSAIRLQTMAQDLEQQIYTEAAKQATTPDTER